MPYSFFFILAQSVLNCRLRNLENLDYVIINKLYIMENEVKHKKKKKSGIKRFMIVLSSIIGIGSMIATACQSFSQYERDLEYQRGYNDGWKNEDIADGCED